MSNFGKLEIMGELHKPHFALLLLDQVSSSKCVVKKYCSTSSCMDEGGAVWVGVACVALSEASQAYHKEVILQGLLKSTGDITGPDAEDIIKQRLNIIT